MDPVKRSAKNARRLGVIAASLLLTAIVGLSTADSGQNDAGTGMDAPDSISNALSVGTYRTFQGNLTPVDPADWYYAVGAVSTPTCIDTAAPFSNTADIDIAAVYGNNQTREIDAQATPTRAQHIGLATLSLKGTTIGIHQALGVAAGYRVTQTVHLVNEFSQSDAGTSGDAPATTTNAPAAASCIGGMVGGSDTLDVYTLAGNAADTVTLTLAGVSGTNTLRLVDPSGTTVGTLTAGQMGTFTLPSTGTYSLQVSSSSTSPTGYLAGVCDVLCGPPQQPCEPMCITLVNGA